MAYEEIKGHGITTDSPTNILLGAGTIHKGLVFVANAWNFAESLIGPTAGGTKLKINPEIKDIELDGAMVKTKGLAIKIGETAELETSLGVLTPEIMKMATLGSSAVSATVTDYTELKSKGKIEAGDYVTNLGYIGRTVNGTPIIIIFDNALCTSGLEIEGKNKDNAVIKLKFECYADIADIELDVLPYHIYYPTAYGA